MAKVIATGDTETGEFSVTIDGVAVENVRDVDFDVYQFDGSDPMCSVSVETYVMQENGVREYGRLCCSLSPEGKAANYAGGIESKYKGFISVPNYQSEKEKYSNATASIAKMFKREQ